MADGLEEQLEAYFVRKAPFQIPAGGRAAIVKISPWITLILLLLLLPAVLAIFGVGLIVGGVAPIFRAGVGALYYVSLLALTAQAGLMGAAIPGLLKRRRRGWKLAYYATLVSAFYGIVHWLSAPVVIFSLLSALISAVVALYILFQIRSYYTS